LDLIGGYVTLAAFVFHCRSGLLQFGPLNGLVAGFVRRVVMSDRPQHGGVARLDFAAGTLILNGIPVSKLDDWFGKSFWVIDARIGAARCDAIRYSQVITELQRRRIRFDDNVASWKEVRWKAEELHDLRPEQLQAVDAWMETGQSGCIVMPTGTG